MTEVYDNSPPDGTPGVLVGFIAGDGRGPRSAADRPSGARGARLLRGLLRPARARRDRIRRARLAHGGVDARRLLPHVRDRRALRFGAALGAPLGPLHFASADIPGEGMMHMDGAVRTGAAAAASLLAHQSASVM